MCDLSVIIVNYNAQHFLQLCLDALQDALIDINAEVIVVDNVSRDNSCSLIKQDYPWVKLITNTENVGFGRANNQGAAIAKGRHLLILNPDTIITKASINKSIALLDNNSLIGGIGVKMLDGSGCFLPESKRGLPSPQVAFYKAFGLTRLFPRSKRFARYYLGHLSNNENHKVEVLAGAFMMIPAKVYKQCKGFDEDFFMYGEDIDLSYRITQLGYQLMYLAETPIIHFKGESTARDAAWSKRFYGAMALFSQKHFSEQGKFLNLLIQWGISLHQWITKPKNTRRPPIKISDRKVTLICKDKEKCKLALKERFQSVNIQHKDEVDFTQEEAVLLSPDLSSDEQIELIQACTKQTLFFFSPQRENFLLLSPSSQDSGQIIF